jgi:hypothetical protein
MPPHLPFDRPPYDVIAVFDPDGIKPSFAYTNGVFEAYGLPEVFVWSIPDAGVDAGEQWELSPSDQHTQLADAVQRLRNGAGPDAAWEHGLDGGRTVLRSTLIAAADDLPTYTLPSGTPVRRLHLELIRPPVGKPSRLPADARRSVIARTQQWADLLLGHELPAVRTALKQVYGPCTAGVELLTDLLAQADEGLLLCVASLECVSEGGTRSAFAELDALARTAGRGSWVARAKADVEARLTAFTLRMPVEDREELDWHAGTAFRCAVTAWVMADLIDEELFRRATASVRAGITRSAGPEDEEPAPPELMVRATRLAADLTAGLVARPAEHEVTAEALRAIWLMAWTGRGRALMTAATDAGAYELLDDDRAWELLAAAVVLDVAPELVTLLPPQHRAA